MILIETGDITRCSDDAIVNAANPIMLGGGGVDGAIHRAAGPELHAACKQVPAVDGVRCPTGEARITEAFNLPSRYVIHTVGPRYHIDPNPPKLLADAFTSSLQLARTHSLKTIAFPAISCGVYGYPAHEAAAIALGTCLEPKWEELQIRFVLFSDDLFEIWQSTLNTLR